MDQGNLAAQIVVTVLVLTAFGLSLGAGISTLKKWREHRARVATYDIDLVRARAFMEQQSKEHSVFLASHPSTEWDAFMAQQVAEAREAGFGTMTTGDFNVNVLVGERPRDTFQAPGEVWVGLSALILATVASVIDVWLT